ncbi:hypothetical protein GCM10025789_10330 [Tessaracoccus lubricantis]|uniref:Uncharacterized protein n=1 Tax=Tessaracoccus lubricantis TaxID=545543 RepID=A0ABP9FCR4_9ACTN
MVSSQKTYNTTRLSAVTRPSMVPANSVDCGRAALREALEVPARVDQDRHADPRHDHREHPLRQAHAKRQVDVEGGDPAVGFDVGTAREDEGSLGEQPDAGGQRRGGKEEVDTGPHALDEHGSERTQNRMDGDQGIEHARTPIG